jgi:hypothetical protein
MKETAVNQAFEALLSAYGWRATQEPVVAATYGPDVLALAKEVYAFALNHPVDWQTTTLVDVLAMLRLAVQAKYPFLTPGSVQQLSSHFSYSWK